MKTYFIKSLNIVCVIFILSIHTTVKAQTLGSLKEKYQYIGINRGEFNSLATFGKQRSLNWCWAACIQMVLNFHRIPVTQEQVVKKTLGKLVDRPADPYMMFKALNGWEVNAYGELASINSNIYPTSTSEITSFVTTKNPLIVGLAQQGVVGHAYVLIGLFYEEVKTNSGVKYKPHSVILIDPFPGNTSIKDMSWDDFADKLMVCYKVWVN